MAQMNRMNGSIQKFIKAQDLFFVATAAPDGRVNLSPKGMDTLRIVDENTIQWLNLSGSGNETAAHVLELPRMTLMFCAFTGSARIVRAYGIAKMFQPTDADWGSRAKHFDEMAGSRQIFELTVDLVQTSCGTGVPEMTLVDQRGPAELLPFFEQMGPDGVTAYWNKKNAVSIDGKKTGIKEA